MRIESQNSQLPNTLAEAGAAADRPAAQAARQSVPQAEGEITAASASSPYVKSALATEAVDMKAVEQARQMLESGGLDTAEAALRAANAMLDGM